MAKTRINVCVSEDRWQKIREFAAKHRMSASAVVDEALERVLRDDEQCGPDRLAAFAEIMATDFGQVGTPEELAAELEGAHAPCLEPGQ
ncbi:MAG: hypothetical protein ABFE08_14420 [Armatimonadia bacterium]